MADAPKPYQFCTVHFKKDCIVCNPDSQSEQIEPPPPVKPGSTQADSAVPKQAHSVEPAPLTDPLAQKVVAAAQNYARAVEAVSVISGQVKETRELLAAFELKLKETKAIAEAAQNELREATTKK
jgi:hypothetical protein